MTSKKITRRIVERAQRVFCDPGATPEQAAAAAKLIIAADAQGGVR